MEGLIEKSNSLEGCANKLKLMSKREKRNLDINLS
jgi:hypothetical protein